MTLRTTTQRDIERERASSVIPAQETLRPDRGPSTLRGFTQGINLGFREGTTVSLITSVRYKLAGRNSREATEEDLIALAGSFAGDIELKKNMTINQLRMVVNDRFNEVRLAESIRNSDSPMSTLAGSFVGLMFDPVDVVLVGGAVAKITAPIKAARTTAEYARLLGKTKMRHILESSKVGARAGFIEAAVVEPFIAKAQGDLQRDYTIVDSFANLAVSPIFGATIGSITGAFTFNSTKSSLYKFFLFLLCHRHL